MKKGLLIAILSLMFSISYASTERQTDKRQITKENTISMPSVIVAAQIQMDVNVTNPVVFISEMPSVTIIAAPVDVGKFHTDLYFRDTKNRKQYNYRNTLTLKELPIKYNKRSVIPINLWQMQKVPVAYNYRCYKGRLVKEKPSAKVDGFFFIL